MSETDSILTSVKKVLGIDASYIVFDPDFIMHINSVFSTLNQLGIGPSEGYSIEDEGDTWDDFLEHDLRYNNIKTYVCLRVRLLFDPPGTSFHITAIKEQIQELEWRLSSQREMTDWVPPTTVVDGGDSVGW